MPYKLIAHALSGEKTSDRSYDLSVMTIGRDEKSDLTLLDARQLVSRRHVEIRENKEQYWLVDLSSKNGTRLNKKKLSPGKKYRLSDGDQIAVGSFLIDFVPIYIASKQEAVPVSLPLVPVNQETPAPGEALDPQFEALTAAMNRGYCEHFTSSAEDRKIALKKVLMTQLVGRSQGERERLLKKIESSYQSPAHQDAQGAAPSQNDKMTAAREKPEERSGTAQVAYDGLLKLAGRYFEHLDFLESPQEMAKFVERLNRVLSVMTTSLANALKGRRHFEQEFDIDATRVLSWRLNPVKECGSGEEIGKYILDWRNEKRGGEAISDLEEGFNDLALHHLGLIAGFKECLRGLLDQLNPDLIEIDGQKGSGALQNLEPMKSRNAWKQYREKYRQLCEEEVKTFENILGPYIAKGYLSVQKRKRTL